MTDLALSPETDTATPALLETAPRSGREPQSQPLERGDSFADWDCPRCGAVHGPRVLVCSCARIDPDEAE